MRLYIFDDVGVAATEFKKKGSTGNRTRVADVRGQGAYH